MQNSDFNKYLQTILSKKSALGLAFAIFTAILFIAFVWPTVYRYDTVPDRKNGAPVPVRINRITGTAYRLDYFNGWVLIDPPRSTYEKSVELSRDELARLRCVAWLDESGLVVAQIYNGNNFALSSINLRAVITYNNSPLVVSEVGLSGYGAPYATSTYNAQTKLRVWPNQRISFTVARAYQKVWKW